MSSAGTLTTGLLTYPWRSQSHPGDDSKVEAQGRLEVIQPHPSSSLSSPCDLPKLTKQKVEGGRDSPEASRQRFW